MEYWFVTTDQAGNETIVERSEMPPGSKPLDVGDAVTLRGEDGVERPWKIVRSAETAYVGMTIYVEPLELE